LADFGKQARYAVDVSAVDLVEDLIELEKLAEQEHDADRRKRLVALADRWAEREAGAKVSEAANILGVSQPTVRAWIAADLLATIPDRSPVRIELSSLAAVKRAVDEIRKIQDDPQLIAYVYRVLRDRALLARPDVQQGLEEYRAGKGRVLDLAHLDELIPPPPKSRKKSSASH
jgi:hypothetical protein